MLSWISACVRARFHSRTSASLPAKRSLFAQLDMPSMFLVRLMLAGSWLAAATSCVPFL